MPIHPLSLILASESISRKELLTRAGMVFETRESKLDEASIVANTPQERAILLAETKAKAIAEKEKTPALIIAADTVVVFNGYVMEKPKYKMTAVEMLKKLQNNIHVLLTGWTVHNSYKNTLQSGFTETFVTFREITHQEIIDYVNDNPVTSWAGAYNSQLSSAVTFVSKIEGSYSGANGLPLEKIIPIIRYERQHPYIKKEK